MERCLRLLKKGGRMGMVLPEGVLNNKNLQSVREYFEGKAKLILICSIPQDVFIAAGATIKPSLVFMKKFTDKEIAEYEKCKKEALLEVTAKHQSEINAQNTKIANCETLIESLKSDLKEARAKLKIAKKNNQNIALIEHEIEQIQMKQKQNKSDKKEAESTLKFIQKLIEDEVKPLVKEKFDYDVPIAKVDDAGITTTGAESKGNQLPTLITEYKKYNSDNKLWVPMNTKFNYETHKGRYIRKSEESEVILNE